MTARPHWLLVSSAAAAALLGVWLPWPVALVVAVPIGFAAGELIEARRARRLRHLAGHVSSWLGDDPAGALPTGRGPGLDELSIALNALGTAYERRGDKLRRERPWRRGLVDAIVGPALLFSADGRLLAANDDARGLLGLGTDGRRVTVVQALGSATLAGAVGEARAAGRPVTVVAEVGGRELEAVASVVGDETLTIVTDRTREQRLAELRRDFVANASHELKTPAASIQALAEAIEIVRDTDPGRTRDLVARLQTESERLVRMVHDLLDLRRIEEPGPEDRAPVDLVDVVRQLGSEHEPRARERDVHLELDLPEHAVVVGVPADLRLVVANLLANAIDYNRPGGRVNVTLTPAAGGHRLVVTDTGIGIAADEHARIFERFYRVDVARSRAAGGTGLGLSLARHAVERHGGRIEVASLLGEGSTFTVHLPVEPGG